MTTGHVTAEARLRPYLAVVSALRPHQWTKNLVLVAGILFSGHYRDGARWSEALVAFAAYCLLSSAGYLVNDVRDAERDRLHPTKRLRAVARGDVSRRRALGIASVLSVAGLAFSATLGPETLLLAAAFGGGQLAYTLALKRVFLLDAVAIAGLFVLRAAAGAAAVDVRISDWLLVCTGLLAMFLAFAKRRGETFAVRGEPGGGRDVLRYYTAGRLAVLVGAAAVGTVAAYVAYTLTGADSNEMVATLPFVLFGLGRYLYLMRSYDLGEEPDRILLTDPVLLASVFLWAATAAAVIGE